MAGPRRQDVTRAPRKDAHGKPVDEHRLPKIGYAFVYDPELAPSREEFQAACLQALRSVRDSPVRRVRERAFSIWHGSSGADTARPATAVFLPYNIALKVFRCFKPPLDLPGYLETGGFAPADVNATPLARYEHGQLIAYASGPAADISSAEDVIVRAARVIAAPVSEARGTLPRPKASGGTRHNIASWEKTRHLIVDWIGDLQTVGRYRRLKQIVVHDLGIQVREQTGTAAPRLGRIWTGWLDDDVAAEVTIDIRADLADDLKYAVLAHELAHYTLHFPLLHLVQCFDEFAAVIPELEVAVRQALGRHVTTRDLECSADDFASYLLIAPWVELIAFSERFVEAGETVDAQEWAWRFLTPLFPNSAREPFGWGAYERLRQRAQEDLDSVRTGEDDTVFARMLLALLRRIDGTNGEARDRVDTGLSEAYHDMNEISDGLVELEHDTARAQVRNALGPDLPLGGAPPDSRPLPYELVEPAVGHWPYPFVALEPAADNPRGADAKGWVDHYAPDMSASLTQWRELIRPHVGLRIYRPGL